ncbi:RNA polymerase sigma factor [Hymenobacter sediminicola]|uniref:RNA polymerase sigma factor n=1 Tax=Hymenobacter sediminicola TaxID=2761579 RepID=A0A7G7W9H9_9BACT|nr:RNA polymerase sigma factor [Hymenobacter sediminicola]QNH63022.1 RNA polymerase sigma factor [Hymenobacter sediminicola]
MARPDLDSALLLNLLAGCQRQERGCQRHLYLQYYSYALSVCLRYLHDRDVALETVNDGFMKVFQELPRFDTSRYSDLAGSLRGWIRRIMVRTAIDQFRASSRHVFQTDLDAVAPFHADGGQSPLDTLSFEELLQVIGQLTPAYRAVFNMFVIDGYSHEEIAEQLGISVGASKSNLSKARAHLRALLKKSNHHAYATYVG